MPSKVLTQTTTVALLGNPNTGKSTLFAALAGVRQKTGNYPGVTVEKKVGSLKIGDQQVELIDLPGTYSLAPRSLDEMVTVDVLLGRPPATQQPDAILCILDASNLQRNLYLVCQALELNLPTVVALNMFDVAERKGMTIDVEKLQQQLGVPVVVTQANKGLGVEDLKQQLANVKEIARPNTTTPFDPLFVEEVDKLQAVLAEQSKSGADQVPRFLVERLLLDTTDYIETEVFQGKSQEDIESIRQAVSRSRKRLAEAGTPVPAVEAIARYGWAGKVLEGVVKTSPAKTTKGSDRLDKILTHKLWGSLAFIAMMTFIFQAVYAWAAPAMEGIEAATGWFGNSVGALLPEGALQSLIVDGIIGGVGAVLVFLPQILILFLFIAILEDCGYMARAAYLMDKLMSRIGLSGKSFIPLLSSFACAVPGVMATRVIENRRDRLVTILIAPLMSCSARLPVYVLLIAAIVPNEKYLGGWLGLQGLTMVGMYAIGMIAAAVVAITLKWTLLPGTTPPFVLELPTYKLPSVKIVGMQLVDRGWAFIKRAGTMIMAVTILVWAVAYYPRDTASNENVASASSEVELSEEAIKLAEKEAAGDQIRQSYLGQAGQLIEPAVKPLGWDWRIGCGVIASFPAREVVIGTLGVIYNLGEDEDERSKPLREKLTNATWDGTDKKVYTLPVAFSVMVFFALCAQCAATLVVIKRETNSWRWPLFTFVYMTGIAYLAAFVTYQVGTHWF